MKTTYYMARFLLKDTMVSVFFLGDTKDWFQVWHALRIADPISINMTTTGCSTVPEKVSDSSKRYIKSVVSHFSVGDTDKYLNEIDKW